MKKRKIGVNGIAMWGIERKIDMKNRKKERGENVEKERQGRRAIFNPNESFFLGKSRGIFICKEQSACKAKAIF